MYKGFEGRDMLLKHIPFMYRTYPVDLTSRLLRCLLRYQFVKGDMLTQHMLNPHFLHGKPQLNSGASVALY